MKNILVLIFFAVNQIFCQVDLLQAFTEKNITGGGTSFGYGVSANNDLNGDGKNDLVVGTLVEEIKIYFGSDTLRDEADLTLTKKEMESGFGFHFTTVDDVNGDNYDDLLVAVGDYSTSKHIVKIYFGGNPMNDSADVILETNDMQNSFGFTSSTAGDINNDSFGDILISDVSYNSGIGRVYIYFGSSEMDTIPDVILDGDSLNSNFGYDVACAGDINNDTFDDIIISTAKYNSVGNVFVYYGARMFNGNEYTKISDNVVNSGFGNSISSPGDVNNDDYDDILVGAPLSNSQKGKAYLYLGGNTINNTPNYTIYGEAQFDHMGHTVSGAGDLNNDGYNDFVIGGRGYNNFQGKAKIYFGSENITNLDSVILVGELEQSLFSEYISSGDINDDGFSDLVISAYNYSSPTGKIYIYYGSTNFDVEPRTITGEGKGNLFGVKVAGSGDINNDGFDDFIVGAPGYNSNTGAAYIYLGNNSSNNTYDLFLKGTTTMSGFGGAISFLGDINNDGYEDFIIGEGKKATIYFGNNYIDSLDTKVLTVENKSFGFGNSLAAAGDINNDGYQDILIGGETMNTDSSRAYIYYGGNIINDKPDVILTLGIYNDSFGWRVSSAGDLNNDNYDDIMISATGYAGSKGAVLIYFGGETINEKPDVMLAGEKSYDYFGNSIANVGDFNGDGFDDILVGAEIALNYTGKAYLFLGGAVMDNIPDLILNGKTEKEYFGHDVAGLGDVNDDGYDDFIISAYYHNRYEEVKGGIYVYCGVKTLSTEPNTVIEGELESRAFGWSISSAGDVNNDGKKEFLVGDLYYPDNGKAYLYSASNITGINLIKNRSLDNFYLSDNYPNPFNPTTSINFTLPKTTKVNLEVYDILGKKITTLINEIKNQGQYKIDFDGTSLSSGVYFYKLQTNEFIQTKKMVILK